MADSNVTVIYTDFCKCGHTEIWHARKTGECQITGPQPSDGCDCTEFRFGRRKRSMDKVG